MHDEQMTGADQPIPLPAAPGARKWPVKTTRLDFNGDYSGFYCVIRANPLLHQIRQFEQPEGPEQGYPQVITEWNFVDEETGGVLPITPEGVGKVPGELLRQLSDQWAGVIGVPLPSKR